MHSGVGREPPWLADPIKRNQLLLEFFFADVGSVFAGEAAYEMVLLVENFERDAAGGSGQGIVNDRSIRRICRGWFVRRKRCVGVGVALHPICVSRMKQMSRLCDCSQGLAQRRDVVEEPEGTP